MNKPEKTAVARRRRFQYTLRSLLLVVLGCSILCSHLAWDLRKAEQRYRVYEHIHWDLYTCSMGEFPWYSKWLHQWLGHEECFDPEFLVFDNGASINDETLVMISQLDKLVQLWLNGEITITDKGLANLKKLTRLCDLSLGDAPVSVEAVEDLRRALPACEISWTPRTTTNDESRSQ